jgi:hypothetical protein
MRQTGIMADEGSDRIFRNKEEESNWSFTRLRIRVLSSSGSSCIRSPSGVLEGRASSSTIENAGSVSTVDEIRREKITDFSMIVSNIY